MKITHGVRECTNRLAKAIPKMKNGFDDSMWLTSKFLIRKFQLSPLVQLVEK